MLMDRAYEGNETRQLVLDLGMIPIVPPKSSRLHPRDYDSCFEKLDIPAHYCEQQGHRRANHLFRNQCG
jgi:hypothetical protein